jgi:hypothetical protein
MAILQQNINSNNARFPQPRRAGVIPNIVFPNDLMVGDRNFITKISFREYSFRSDILPDLFTGGLGDIVGNAIDGIEKIAVTAAKTFLNIDDIRSAFPPSPEIGDIILPMPKKINDNITLSWNDQSVLEHIPKLGGVAAGISTSSFMTGVTINPFVFMFFQKPNFKEFVLQWTFTPNTPMESETVNIIIERLQKASLPTKVFYGGLLKYPHVLDIEFFPEEFGQQMAFKLCAITSVQVDYSGAGTPSFFKGTNLPTVITLSLSLKEIELWDSTEIGV